jgi:ATP-dependent Clp protease protease subunit
MKQPNKFQCKVNQVKAEAGTRMELLVYDIIGTDWMGNGLAAKDVAEQLSKAEDVSEIDVRINSVGGDVFDGLAIYHSLRRHSAKKVVNVEGLAASSASLIAMAGDEIRMHTGSMMMVHDPWTIAMGSADDMIAVAEQLEKVTDGLVDVYAEKTGIDKKELRGIMRDETWMTATEAQERGFADTVVERQAVFACADISKIERFPERLRAQIEDIQAEQAKQEPTETPTMITREQFDAFIGENPDAVAAYIEQGRKAGIADARAEFKLMLDTAGTRIDLAAKSFAEGRDIDTLKAVVEELNAAEEKHQAALKVKQAELDRFNASGTAPVALPPQKPEPAPARNSLSIHDIGKKTSNN